MKILQQPSDVLFAQLTEKALRSTLGAFSDMKTQLQFIELVKQQFNILTGKQNDTSSIQGSNDPQHITGLIF